MAETNPTTETTFVALLRGINVGGRHKLPMADLRSLAESLGGTRPETYIQSGNLVFGLDPASSNDFARRLAAGIEERFGFSVPIILRRGDELRRVVQNNPFLRSDTDIRTLHVGFLMEAPSAERVASLDPDRSPPDRVEVIGNHAFLEYPNGLARSKLTNAYLDSRLKTIGTVRNWRTTLKLLSMIDRRANGN